MVRQISIKEAEELLKCYEIPFCEGKLAKTAEEAVEFSKEIGYPVAMKIDSADIIHKTDAGGVKVGIMDEKEAEVAFNSIIDSAKEKYGNPHIEGIYIQPIAHGTEIIIGMKRDEQFGPVIAFGLGGIFVEVLKDVTLRIAPLKRENAVAMINQIKSIKILEGVRGKPPADKEALIDIILKVSKMCMENEHLAELDFNPVFVSDKGASIVDTRIMVYD